MFKFIVTLRDWLPIESVCLDDIRTSLQVRLMDSLNNVWLTEYQEIIIVLELLFHIFK